MDYFFAKQLYKPFRKNIKSVPYFGHYRSAATNRVPGIALSASNHPNLPIPLHNPVLYNIPKQVGNPNNPDIQTLRGPLPAASVKHETAEKQDTIENSQSGAGKIKLKKKLGQEEQTKPNNIFKKNPNDNKDITDEDDTDFEELEGSQDEDKDFDEELPAYEEPDNAVEDTKEKLRPSILQSFLNPRFKTKRSYVKRIIANQKETNQSGGSEAPLKKRGTVF
jgi:hypothetical protein